MSNPDLCFSVRYRVMIQTGGLESTQEGLFFNAWDRQTRRRDFCEWVFCCRRLWIVWIFFAVRETAMLLLGHFFSTHNKVLRIILGRCKQSLAKYVARHRTESEGKLTSLSSDWFVGKHRWSWLVRWEAPLVMVSKLTNWRRFPCVCPVFYHEFRHNMHCQSTCGSVRR